MRQFSQSSMDLNEIEETEICPDVCVSGDMRERLPLTKGTLFQVVEFDFDVTYFSHRMNSISDFGKFVENVHYLLMQECLNDSKDKTVRELFVEKVRCAVVELHPHWELDIARVLREFHTREKERRL